MFFCLQICSTSRFACRCFSSAPSSLHLRPTVASPSSLTSFFSSSSTSPLAPLPPSLPSSPVPPPLPPSLPPSSPAWMRAWVCSAFGLPLTQTEVPVPAFLGDNQILVRVKASSVNPIDVRMSEGYGKELLAARRFVEEAGFNAADPWRLPHPAQLVAAINKLATASSSASASHQQHFPLVLGRDCSGEVVEVGRAAKERFKAGDQVIAVIPVHWPGAHAEYVVVPSNGVALKPATVSHVEAASFPYVACTAWSALVTMARLKPNNATGIRALVHGGSGGVGTMAIQMLKCWGADKVVATCSAENKLLVELLGAVVIDYRSERAKAELIAEGPFDVIFDCVDSDLAAWSDQLLGIWRNCVHVTVNTPLLRDTDRYGVPMGIATTAFKLMGRNIGSTFQKGALFVPSYFSPSAECLKWVTEAVEAENVRPVIEQVFTFDKLPEAYEKVGQMHGKGKTVIDFAAKTNEEKDSDKL